MCCAVLVLQIIYCQIRYSNTIVHSTNTEVFPKNYKLACRGKQTAKDELVVLGKTTVTHGLTVMWVNAVITIRSCYVCAHVILTSWHQILHF